MDFMTALDIGASALSAERTALNVTAMNLANAKTTRSLADGNSTYIRRTVLKTATEVDSPFSKQMESALDRELRGVRVAGVVRDNRPPVMRYEPGHPDANAEGMVAYPDINVVEEMANMMTIQRNYEANVATVDSIKTMYTRALDIGK